MGGKTLKNVAGYDVVKLFIGSMGAYGIILNATIKLDSKNYFKDIKIDETVDFEKNPDFSEAMPGAISRDYVHQTANFAPGKYSRRLKKVFDPKNLFNYWLYENKSDGPAITGKM